MFFEFVKRYTRIQIVMIVLVAVLAYVALPILVSTGAGLFVFDSFGFLAHAALPVRFAACKLSLPTQ